jgi:glycine/sarcosine N-methyltransferase
MNFKIGLQFDEAINWQGRLAQELPFLQSWLNSWQATHVLDLACGSGRHTAALAGAGYQMTGSDLQDDMLEEAARQCAKTPCTLIQKDMCENHDLPAQDAILCLGNSLCLLPDMQHVTRCLDQIFKQLKPTGGIILHVLNYDRFIDPDMSFFPLRTLYQESGEVKAHFQKIIELHSDFAHVHMLKISNETSGWNRQHRSDRLLRFDASSLQQMVQNAGFHEVQIYGNMKGETYCSATSHDMILTAKKWA